MSLAIGIDLGTTNSVAAVNTRSGARLAVAQDGSHIHPSVVGFPPEGGVIVGDDAKQRRAIDPENTIHSVKRLIGQNIRAPLVELALSALPYRVEEGPNRQPIVMVRGRRMTIPEVSALVLGHLKRTAEDQFGDDINEAVITVPANFSDAQRKATKEAGIIAGLDVLRLINEPTAAALAYGYGRDMDNIVAVFDFGGGTFDVSILKIRSEIFEVLTTGGDFFLGGDDIDRALARHLAGELKRQTGIEPGRYPEAITRLMLAAEQIKCYLSSQPVASGDIDGIVIGDQEVSMPFEITRGQFDDLIVGYVDKTIEVCRQVMHSAKLEPPDVGDVILVGGSTRIPLVRERVAHVFRSEPSTRINPDEVVAHGAAIQASMLSEAFAEIPVDSRAAPVGWESDGAALSLDLDLEGIEPPQALLLDVTPATLSVGTAGGFTEMLLERNAPIPIEHTRVFTTARDRQDRVVIDCCRGEHKRFADNELLGSLVLDEIPPAPRGEAKIEVTFRVDADGMLHVRAKDVRTGRKREAKLNVLGAPVEDTGHGDSPEVQ